MKKIKEDKRRNAAKSGEDRRQYNFRSPKLSSSISFYLLLSFSVFFVALSWYFLYVRNADTLFFLQDRGWWNSTRLFWDNCMSLPGGLLSWAGAYLTQFFYYPALGCSVLILLWILTFGLAKWSFKVANEWSFLLFIPLAALLCSIIQLGYWVYILKSVDYVFYHSLGLFAALLLSVPFWRYLPVKEKTQRWIALAWIPLVAALFYYPLGIYALLAAAIVTINNSKFKIKNDGLLQFFTFHFSLFALLLLTLWLVPLLETSGTTLMRPEQPWTYGFQFFELDTLRDCSFEAPFYVVFVAALLFPFLGKLKAGKLLLSQSLMAVVGAGMFFCLAVRDFDDYNFHAELRMQRGVEECRWEDVLREAAKVKGPVTREMVMFRDIALINRGELCSKRYIYNNESIPPVTMSDSIHLRIADQAADLIYYNYGETIFAIRRAIERCMHYGFSYYTMRMLTQCAIVNGEAKNARKYLRLLSKTTFQKKWADEMLRYVNDRKLMAENERFQMEDSMIKRF